MTSCVAVAADRAGSPHFASPAGEGIEGLPLEATRTDVTVSGVVANVVVRQRYRNRGTVPIEAVYVFPGSSRSAVHALVMRIGDRVVRAKIDEKERARQAYEAAKAQGKTASLLEQQRPNVFTMNVANIVPGDVIDVEFEYAELLESVEGEYEVVVPAVVGPRYTGAASREGDLPATSHLHAGESAPYKWEASVTIDAGVPVVSASSPSHKVDARIQGTRAEVLPKAGQDMGTADFVVRYSLRGDAVSSGVVLFPGNGPDDEQFFLVNVQPPKALDDVAIPDREYVFVVDVSGSMHGFPINTAKDLMNDLLSGLRPSDKYNILTFSGGSNTLSEQSLSATPTNVAKGLSFMSQYAGGGGTEIVPALKRALAMPAAPSMSRIFVVVTDGYVTVEAEAFELIANNLGKANLFSFGIGSSVNRSLIDGMARAGGGEPFVVLGPGDVEREVTKLRKMIASPALTRVQVSFDGFDAYDVEPAVVSDLFAERPVVVFGKYRGKAKGRVTVAGYTGQGRVTKTVNVAAAVPDEDNEALRVLWARRRVERITDQNHLRADVANKKAITDLGLRYSILTAYTSFVAVDERVRADGRPVQVDQPQPMPRGVEDTAVATGTLGPMAVGAAPPTTAVSEEALSGVGFGAGGGGVPVRRPAPAKMLRPSPEPAQFNRIEGRKVSANKIAGDRAGSSGEASVNTVVQVSAVSGGLTLSQVRGLTAKIRAALAGLTGTGQAVVELTVDASGVVTAVKVVSDAGLAPLRTCESTLKALLFGAAPQGSTIRLLIHRG